MVEFAVEEWKRVVIHEINHYELNDLMKLHALGLSRGGTGRSFLWADGVLFEHNNMPPTEEIVEDQLKGTIHWSSLQFAFMPEFQNILSVDGVSIHVGDVSTSKLFSAMATWLKETYKTT